MALTDEQRGPQAAWLYHHLVARFGRGEVGLRGLADALAQRGMRREPDTIKGWIASEERSPIPPEVLPHLEAIFDDHAPARRQPASSADLIAALSEQAAAVRELVAELKVQSERQAGWNEGLAVLAARLVQVIEGQQGTQ